MMSLKLAVQTAFTRSSTAYRPRQRDGQEPWTATPATHSGRERASARVGVSSGASSPWRWPRSPRAPRRRHSQTLPPGATTSRTFPSGSGSPAEALQEPPATRRRPRT